MIKILPGLAVAITHPLYYLFLQIAIEADQPSSTATYAARAAALLLLGMLTFFSFHSGRLKAKWSYLHLSLIIFMSLYLLRIYVLHSDGIWNLDAFYHPYSKVFPLFLLGVILPCILCLFSSSLFTLQSTSNTFIFFTFLSIVGLTLMNLDQFGTFRTEGVEAGSISPLSLGYMAALGIGYCLLDFLRLKKYPFLLIVVFLACGVFLLTIGASRGPIVAIAVSAVYIFLTMEKTFKNLISGVLLVSITIGASVSFVEYSGSGLLDRIDRSAEAFSEGDTQGRGLARLSIYEETIQIIKENSVLGSDIALPSGHWPHNYVLEATMAVGIFAIFLVIPWLAALGKIFIDTKADEKQWLYLWFLQTTVMNMFTEAIWSGTGLFICLFLVLGSGSGSKNPARENRMRGKRKRRRRREVHSGY